MESESPRCHALRIFYVLIPMLFLTADIQAQYSMYGASLGSGFIGNQSYLDAKAIDTDTGGVSYVTGSDAAGHFYLKKFSPQCILQFTDSTAGKGTAFGKKVKADGAGHIYVLGHFTDSVLFSTTWLTGAGDFLAKYADNGAFEWCIHITFEGNDLKVTKGLRPVLAGTNGDAVIRKYDINGALMFSKTFSGAGMDVFTSLSINYNGRIYVAGTHAQSIVFDTTVISGAGSFLTLLSSDGNVIRAMNTGTSIVTGYPIVETDAKGNTYLQVESNKLKKFTGNGQLIWNKTISPPGVTNASGICKVDSAGTIYFYGHGIGYMGYTVPAIAKLNSNGSFLWFKTGGGLDYAYEEIDIDFDHNGWVYVIDYSKANIQSFSYGFAVIGSTELSTYGLSHEILCQSKSYSINYTINNLVFQPGNVFTAEINTSTGWLPIGSTSSVKSGSIPVSFPWPLAGNYYIRITSSLPAIAGRTSDDLLKMSHPYPQIIISGDTTFCHGEMTVLTHNNSGAGLYFWDGVIKDTLIVTTTGNHTLTALYSIGSSANDCYLSAGPLHLTALNLPLISVSPSGPTTFCNGDSVVLTAAQQNYPSYQWKKNNGTIAGGTGTTLTAKLPGTYKLKVTDTNGCTQLSNAVNVVVPCRESAASGISEGVSLYPNPVEEILSMGFSGVGTSSEVHCSLYDLTGHLVKNFMLNISNSSEFHIDVRDLEMGMYFIRIQSGAIMLSDKFIKE